jgi:hypothetical protein
LEIKSNAASTTIQRQFNAPSTRVPPLPRLKCRCANASPNRQAEDQLLQQKREIVMNTRHHICINTRTSLFALTLAAVAATALAPISASAAWGPGGVYGRTPGNNNGGGFGGKPNGSTWSPGQTRPGGNYGGGQAGHPGGWNQGGYHPGSWGSDWRPSYGSNGYWHRPGSYWYGSGTYTTAPVVTYAPAPVQTYTSAPVQTTYAPPAYVAPVQPAANQSCNCLTKSYAPDGTVVFADNCSKETATAAPGGAQAGYQPR